jgi:hypothetical protein
MTLYSAEMALRARREQQQAEEHHAIELTDEQVAAVDEQSDQVERDEQ